jgi:hypothetical protein
MSANGDQRQTKSTISARSGHSPIVIIERLKVAGFVTSGSTAGCRTTPPSPATVMAGSGRATSCGICSRRWCSGACARVLLAAKASRWMRT